MDNRFERDESFRDTIGTITEEGKRKWIYPKKPRGKFYKYRSWLSYFLLIILFAGPWIKINGQPLLLINIFSRKFILFGQVFWPQDFYLFVLIMIGMIIFIIAFTTVFGRIFCGWICPQTIFMEMVYRKIEYWIEGDYKLQQKLRKQNWNFEKIWKRVLKHSLFYLIAVVIAHTFLAYIIGADALLDIQRSPLSENLIGFISLLLFSGVFYFVFAWFREQVCIIACPYGRLQGVMLDRNSMVVAYDYNRGESRSKFRKKEDRKSIGKGDCIDCHQCVDVCPTGIDIRNGTQLECINCTACMDACDSVMEKVGYDKGLIRYDSENALANGVKNKFSPRSKAYVVFLVLLIGVIGYLFSLRGDLDATVLRTPGMQFQVRENGYISNLYNVKILNKTTHEMEVLFKLENTDGLIEMVGNKTMLVPPGDKNEQALFVLIKKDDLKQSTTHIKIGIYADGKLIKKVKTNFLGPE
jgi:cytochrome c oxidase accessory protein FixG